MKIGISGAELGRMGQAVDAALKDFPGFTRVDVAASDAVIDFTAPEYTLQLAAECARQKKILITGTTGFTTTQLEQLRTHAKSTAIVWSGNFSFGVAVLSALVERAASLLGTEYDIEIDEMHHALKKDAPSGTALLLADAAAKGRGIKRDDALVYYGPETNSARKTGTIGMSVRRGGEVVGVHTVTFAGPGENLELTHRGFSRSIYARGALKAAQWAKGKPPGLYSIREVVGL